jgi:Flp pilus assembly protein TadG
VTLVEFALVSPMLFLFLLGLVVTAIVLTNQVQITNAVRDGARAAAVCGGPARNDLPTEPDQQPIPKLPDGGSCDSTSLITFIQKQLNAVPTSATLSVCVYTDSGCTSTLSNVLDECAAGKIVEVDASFQQPLYLPLVGRFLGDNGANYRTVKASAQAVCEQ